MRLTKFFLLFVLLAFGGQVNLAYGQDEWQAKHSRHFVIKYKDAPEDFIRTVQDTAERFYEDITRNLGFSRFSPWTQENNITIYIYRDQQDYLESSQTLDWSHGVAYFRRREIRTFPAAHGFFDTVLPHELGHIIFRGFVGENQVIPLWLDEGVAMFQEKAKRWGAHKIVKQAVADGRFVPLRQLSQVRLSSETPREDLELFYAEAASVVYYMINELGQQRFVNFCRALRAGEKFSEALRRTYPRFKNIDVLNKSWMGYLDRQ